MNKPAPLTRSGSHFTPGRAEMYIIQQLLRDWGAFPSFIEVWGGGCEIGTWSSPADFGGKRGALTLPGGYASLTVRASQSIEFML